MGRRTQRPVNAETISEYAELRRFAKKFGEGAYNCLIFVGPPGRLKSSIIEEETKGKAHLISGHAKPFEVFCELQEHKDQLVIIDDADGLYIDSDGQRLLKAITNPRKPTTVSWTTAAPTNRGLEKRFDTTSRVCIIDNAWNAQNEHIAALEDRCRLFVFNPSPQEVHFQMEKQDWFADDEVYKFIGEQLVLFNELSARIYVKAVEAKEAGEDWRNYILKACINSVDKQIILLEYETAWKDKSTNEKNDEFRRRTGLKARQTYYNHRTRLVERLKGHPLVGKWSRDPTPEPVEGEDDGDESEV